MIPRTGAVISCPTTQKEYQIIGPVDQISEGPWPFPSNMGKGNRLWVLCGFGLDDKPVIKTTSMIRKFNLVKPGKRIMRT